MSKRAAALASTLAAVAIAAVAVTALRQPGTKETVAVPAATEPQTVAPRVETESDDSLAFRVPSGHAGAVSCEDARRILEQIRSSRLAWAPDKVAPDALASGTSDWLDPYGLSTAFPSCPAATAVEEHSRALLAELESVGNSTCPASLAIGLAMAAWHQQIALELQRSRRLPVSADARPWAEPWSDVAEPDGSARHLASVIGDRLGKIERALGAESTPFVSAAIERYAPTRTADEWSTIVLAAAVRAYVPLIDPHGAWAPVGEEASVYDLDLEASPPARVWSRATRCVLGMRVDEGGRAPLSTGDLVLEIDGVSTAGLPPEQVDQLALHGGSGEMSVVYIDAASAKIVRATFSDGAQERRAAPSIAPAELPVTRVAYGEGSDVALIAIADVPDDLGRRFITALDSALRGTRPLVGIILDLRGNGGGSTEGVVDVLGTLIPGAPLFPMKRRDGTIEVERAPSSDLQPTYRGPMATLVDAGTASAAEMLAGALSAYHRAAMIGATTYGKGCAQEYSDDDAHAGVLRLTTLLFSLPDGAAVQGIGLTPWARVAFVATDVATRDREALLPHAPPSWRGPDVRDPQIVIRSEVPWPSAFGRIGPCVDPRVCEAIVALPGARRPHEPLRGPSARGR